MKHLSGKLFLLTIALVAFVGCGGDSKEEGGGGTTSGVHNDSHNHDVTKLKGWLTVTMDEWYLWNEDFKAKTVNYNDINNNEDYQTFFQSLLSTNRDDGREYENGDRYFYSYIDRRTNPIMSGRSTASGPNSLGVDFWPVQYEGFSDPWLLVTYVVPGSNAANQGLKRGQAISTVNGIDITSTNYADMYYDLYPGRDNSIGASVELIVWQPEISGGKVVLASVGVKTIAASSIADSPLQFAKTFTVGTDKVGYFLYNAFESGTSYVDYRYDAQMKQTFRETFSGCNTVVIDLRYNGGGDVASAQLMVSMLLASNASGKDIGYYQYNADKHKELGNEPLKCFTSAEMQQRGSGAGTYLGVKKVYALVTANSASASELVVHCLRGMDVPVYVIGETTEGKNGGMFVFGSNDDAKFNNYYYEAAIMAFYMKNKKGQIGPRNGIVPEYEIDEFNYFLDAFGSETEPMLNAALTHIQSGKFPVSGRSAVSLLHKANVEFEAPDNGRPKDILRYVSADQLK